MRLLELPRLRLLVEKTKCRRFWARVCDRLDPLTNHEEGRSCAIVRSGTSTSICACLIENQGVEAVDIILDSQDAPKSFLRQDSLSPFDRSIFMHSVLGVEKKRPIMASAS